MRWTIRAGGGRWLPYALLLLAAGLLYRASFISQGFAATDEGWLQSLGSRIAQGQLPYRDFDYALPPLSIYKEAALIKVFGDAYGVLASRWAFVLLATLGSVFTFLIVRRYVDDRLAFWATVPTLFMSVILYYFSNYNYDAEVLLLAAIALLVWARPGRPLLPLLAGAAAGLALLAKPTYGAFLPAVVVAALAAARLRGVTVPAGLRQWPLVLVGAGIPVVVVAVVFTVAGAARDYLYQAFFLYRAAHPGSLLSLLVQGIPHYLARPAGIVAVLILALLLLPPRWPLLNRLRMPAVIVGLGVVLLLTLALPDRAEPSFLVAAFVVLWGLNLMALVAGIRGGFPSPELPLFALALLYLAQITFNGVVLYYVGTYLAVPVALLYLMRMKESSPPTPALRHKAGGWRFGWLARAVGLWLVVGSLLVTRMNVYEDAPRTELTSAFQSQKLRGITSLPATTQRLDAAVSAVERLSRPGEPVLAFPDFAVVYFLTDRVNPTRVDWYNTGSITPAEVTQAVADLQRHPPRVVLLQRYGEADYRRSGRLAYRAEPKWDPIYEYLVSHYRKIGSAGDTDVLVPAG